MKRVHAGAKSKKHGCSRCRDHVSKITTFKRKTGRLYCLCDKCIKAVDPRPLIEVPKP